MYRSNAKVTKAEGIILSRKNIGEADRIVTVFTKEFGKMRLMAKGIRKTASRRAPYLEIFSHVVIVTHQGKGMESITEVTPIGAQDLLRDDLERISVAYFYCELVNHLLPEKQEHRDVFALLCDALDYLRTCEVDAIGGQSKQFALTLLRHLGFLEGTRDLGGKELQTFIENITERRLRTPKLIKQVFLAS